MKVRIGIIATLLLLGFLPAAEAQEEGGTTIYLHGMDASWGGTPMVLSFSPPTGAESGTTCTGCAGPDPFTEVASWTVPVDLTHNGGTTVTATGFLKSWNNGPAPQSTLAYNIKVDGTSIASGSATEDVLAGAIVQFDMEMDYSGGDIPAGSEMSLEFAISDESTGGYNPFAYPKEGPSYPWSFILPVDKPLPPPPGVVLDDAFAFVNATSLDLGYEYSPEDFPSGADQQWTYNWTNDNPTGNITFGGNVTQGSVLFQVIDDLGDDMLNASIEAPLELNQTFEGFEGNWTIRVLFDDFIGTAFLDIQTDVEIIEIIPGVPVEEPEEEFVDGNTDESEDTPPVPVALLLVGLVLLARRKRN